MNAIRKCAHLSILDVFILLLFLSRSHTRSQALKVILSVILNRYTISTLRYWFLFRTLSLDLLVNCFSETITLGSHWKTLLIFCQNLLHWGCQYNFLLHWSHHLFVALFGAYENARTEVGCSLFRFSFWFRLSLHFYRHVRVLHLEKMPNPP